MRIKLDENLPTTLVISLRAVGHDVDTVREEGLAGRDDEPVWAAALASRVRALFETEQVETWARCFVVITDRKVRVRRPQG